MTDKIFVDTNILVYAYIEDDTNSSNLEKHKKAKEFLNGLSGKEVNISTQILNEIYSALKKNGVKDSDSKYYVEYCIEKYNVFPITVLEVKTCLDIRDRYGYSYWDSLVLGTAINNDCKTVYSEDMQNMQSIYSILKIINPLSTS